MERLTKIIKILNNSQGFVSAEDLAAELNVTQRTIRSDLAALEELLRDESVRLIKKRNQGIALDKRRR